MDSALSQHLRFRSKGQHSLEEDNPLNLYPLLALLTAASAINNPEAEDLDKQIRLS